MTGETDDGVQVLHGEVAVFVEQQQADGDDDGESAEEFFEALFLGFAHPFDQEEVGNGGCDQLDDELRRTPSVEQK